MVVEDEPDIYEVLLAMFGIWGIEGVAFVDGEEAVSWIEDVDHKRFQGELPELALLDIRLPGEIKGTQVGERLRKSAMLNDIAVVLTTAYHLTADEEKRVIVQAGADRLIYKPLPKFGELQAVLETTIAERRAAKAHVKTPLGANGDGDVGDSGVGDVSSESAAGDKVGDKVGDEVGDKVGESAAGDKVGKRADKRADKRVEAKDNSKTAATTKPETEKPSDTEDQAEAKELDDLDLEKKIIGKRPAIG